MDSRDYQVQMDFAERDENFNSAALQSTRFQSQVQYVHTEFTNKTYLKQGGLPIPASFTTKYSIALSAD